MAWALYFAIYTNKTVPGWTSTIVSTVFLSGIQLIVLGIIGEYLGKLFIENKRRPNYIIQATSIKVQGSKFRVQGLKYDNKEHEAIAESRFVGKEQETLNSELWTGNTNKKEVQTLKWRDNAGLENITKQTLTYPYGTEGSEAVNELKVQGLKFS